MYVELNTYINSKFLTKKVFNTKNHLHNHWVNVHKPKDPNYKRIQYSTCDICGKKYRRKMDVIKHKRDEHKFITAGNGLNFFNPNF